MFVWCVGVVGVLDLVCEDGCVWDVVSRFVCF